MNQEILVELIIVTDKLKFILKVTDEVASTSPMKPKLKYILHGVLDFCLFVVNGRSNSLYYITYFLYFEVYTRYFN